MIRKKFFLTLSAAALAAGLTPAMAADVPTLAFNPANMARVKQLLASDSEAAARWNVQKKIADDAIATQPKGDRNIDAALEALALAYRVTDDGKYARAARDLLIARAQKKDWLTDLPLARRDPPWKSDLGMGFAAASSGIAYDAIRPTLSSADRNIIVQGIINGAIEPIVDDWIDGRKRIHALDTMGHNWWGHIVFGAGVAALALKDDDSRALEWAKRIDQASTEWFSFTGSRIESKPATFGTDGAYSETIGYAELGLHSLMLFRRSWVEAFGAQPSPIANLEKTADYFIAAAYPKTSGWSSLNFGDSRPPSCGCHTLADFWALGDRNPAYLTYIAGFSGVAEKDAWKDAINLPYFPSAAERQAARAPISKGTTTAFPSQGLLSMRDSWNEDATLFALKSGFTWNHNHADAGSFNLYHKGQSLIVDSGHSSYSTPEYDGYFRQSVAHNVVTIDGKAEPPSDLYDGSHFMGAIDHVLSTPDIRYAWADATGPTSRYFQRNYRNILWIGDTILIIDDLRSWEIGQFEWLFHYQGNAKKTGKAIRIHNGTAAADVTPLFPNTLPDGGLPTDYPYAMRLSEHEGLKDGETQVKQSYLGFQPAGKTDREKFLVAIQPLRENRPVSKIEKLEGLDWIGVRILGPDRTTEVYMNKLADGRLRHRNANTTLAGYETDAYLFAISWPRGASPIARRSG
ncbi:heparinase II/III family protein [Sphingobium sp. WW5]|uniref:heparinase II/III domain-containing protein n=1 Tax=unclassified Sphingobium TaxID=2611147 RepID=UPI003C201FC4